MVTARPPSPTAQAAPPCSVSHSPQGRAACFSLLPRCSREVHVLPAPRAVSGQRHGLEHREDSACWLEAGTSPLSVAVSWGGSVSHWGLYKPQVNGGVC